MHQNENYLIDDHCYWVKTGNFEGSLNDLLDSPKNLWGTGFSSYQGTNDRIFEEMCSNYNESLYFIRPKSLKIIVRIEGKEFSNTKRKVRAKFEYNGITYIFPVTDPVVERKYLSKENSCFTLPIEKIYLCVSVGLPYKGYCYKFLASIIEII
ncbi:MAG: hypothetical protein KAH84_04970 [Thiomargarita sp.]|nr:hypothetical protein [Thiomargarita sp.]